MKSMYLVLGISKSNYHKYKDSIDPDYYDYLMIRKVFEDSKKTYGYRRVTRALKEVYGWIVNHKKVARIMRKYCLIAEYIRRSKSKAKNLYSEEEARVDLLKRNFKQRGWVTDITYLTLKGSNKRAYLSTILDLETRNWISYKISYRNDNRLVMDTLVEAIHKTKDLSGLLLHSDQGYQYLSTEYKIICESHGIVISHSRKGTPLDNAVIESFHSILKKETIYNNSITSIEQYVELVHEWMYFYNTTRLRN